MKDMAIANALFKSLLEHYWLVRDNKGLQPFKLYPKGHLISYGTLCDRAGVPFMTQSSGGPLHDVAVYCHENGLPPINALAVNHESRYPGDGYFTAPGCGEDLQQWVNDVEAVLAFPFYPKSAPTLVG